MKVLTLVKKLFGESSVQDYMDTLDEEDQYSVLEYYSIQLTEDASEPDYFVKLFIDGLYTLRDVNGNMLIHTYKVQDLKNKLKVLAL